MDKHPVVWNIVARVWAAGALYSTRARRSRGKRKRGMCKTTTFDKHDVPELADTSAELFVSILNSGRR